MVRVHSVKHTGLLLRCCEAAAAHNPLLARFTPSPDAVVSEQHLDGHCAEDELWRCQQGEREKDRETV